MPAEDSIDEALSNFRNGGDMLEPMLNVRLQFLNATLYPDRLVTGIWIALFFFS